MLAAERHRRILTTLAGGEIVGTAELATTLGVSVETVRRDLVELEDRGRLERVRGGAVIRSRSLSHEPAYATRAALAPTAKATIAAQATTLVEDGMTVMVDVGTTALQVARVLARSFTGTVVTCSVPAAAALVERPGIEVLLSGGRVRPGDLALSNHIAAHFFEQLRPDVAFLGSGGLESEAGLTDYYLDETETRRVVLRHATKSYVLADSSKFGVIATHRVCGLEEFTGLITEQRPPRTLATALRRGGVEIHAPS